MGAPTVPPERILDVDVALVKAGVFIASSLALLGLVIVLPGALALLVLLAGCPVIVLLGEEAVARFAARSGRTFPRFAPMPWRVKLPLILAGFALYLTAAAVVHHFG